MKYELLDSWEDWKGNKYKTVKTQHGSTVFYKNDVIHREDGPAIIDFDGGETWVVDGKRHREDGPAVTEPDGTKEWWIDGKMVRAELPWAWQRLLDQQKG